MAWVRDRAVWPEAELRAATGRRRLLVLRVAITIGVCAGAYHYSLTTLMSGVGQQIPLAYLALVPAISLLVAAVSCRPSPHEPDIHDRYLDYIIGIPLVCGALAILVVLPVVLAAFFWYWRLDLISLPLFAAGAVALCFGSRALWRLRFAIAFLALACPGLYVLFVNGGSQSLTEASLAAVRRLLALLPLARPDATNHSLFLVSHGAQRFVLRVEAAGAGVDGGFAFLLLGAPLAYLMRGPRAVRLAWLLGGVAVTWALSLAWLLALFAAGGAWGERVAVHVLNPYVGPAVFDLGVLGMLAALPALRLRFDPLAEWWPAAGRARAGARPAVRRVGPAVAVLLVAGAVAAAANSSLQQFQLVERPLGQPLLAPAAALNRPVSGWTIQPATSPAWVDDAVGGEATWERYQYLPRGGAAPTGPPVTLDLITTSSAAALTGRGLEDVYPLRTYRLVEARQLQLGGGVVGHCVVYRARSSSGAWMAVSWDWPVQSSRGVAYERMVLNVSSRSDAELRSPPPAASPGPDVRSALVDVLSGSPARQATPAQTRTLDFLAGLGRQVVLSSAGRAG